LGCERAGTTKFFDQAYVVAQPEQTYYKLQALPKTVRLEKTIVFY
jgi:hypothetical protein